MKFLIVESPHKAKAIQSMLGREWTVKASVGHITEMPMPKAMTPAEKAKYGNFAQDTKAGFEPLFKISPDKKKVVSELKTLMKKADELYLGTDPDNEGAAIAWHLLDQLKPTVPSYRVTWNEITEKAVKAGIQARQLIDFKKQEPKDFFGQAESALTRAQWDRIYGFASSPYVWKALKPGTSSGRVQTPGARLIVEREERRLAFTSVAFYSIWGDFEGARSRLIEFEGEKIADGSKIDENGNVTKGYKLMTDETLAGILEALKKKNYAVKDVTSKPHRRSPPAPFTTSSALQSIGGKTRQSAKQITRNFQELYANDSAVTYIRTVSVVAAPEAIAEARKEIKQQFGAKLLPASPRVYKDKGSGNSGHECLRPVLDDKTGKLVNPSFTDAKKQQTFDLIRLRFLASQAIDCEGVTWTAIIEATDKQAKFSSSETDIHEPGWTVIYQLDEEVGA